MCVCFFVFFVNSLRPSERQESTIFFKGFNAKNASSKIMKTLITILVNVCQRFLQSADTGFSGIRTHRHIAGLKKAVLFGKVRK